MGLSQVNNQDTYERDFGTLEFSVVDQQGKEIIIRIVTHCVCDSIWHFPLFSALAYSHVADAGVHQSAVRGWWLGCDRDALGPAWFWGASLPVLAQPTSSVLSCCCSWGHWGGPHTGSASHLEPGPCDPGCALDQSDAACHRGHRPAGRNRAQAFLLER